MRHKTRVRIHFHLALALVLAGCPMPMPTPMPSLATIAGRLLDGFEAQDTDGNGLSYTEARREVGSLAQSDFDALDTDGDGLLSQSELARAAGRPLPEPDRDGEDEEPVEANLYSWDGSWSPTPGELPPPGLYDSIYFDGHLVNGLPSPILPPGKWDFVNLLENRVFPLANHGNFITNIATIVPLMDGDMNPYGWRLDPVVPDAPSFTEATSFYQGSSGTDLADAGRNGHVQSSAFRLGDGPDVLRFATCIASNIRTGSSEDGGLRDNDLVIAGDEILRAMQNPAIRGATIHTGPGSDLVFLNNMEQAAVDLGNGADGRTDTIDPEDGDDTIIIGLNFRDSRVFGGNGDDVFVWYIDEEAPTELLLANNFFGGGGWPPAVWEDTGTDRLILVVPDNTEVISGLGSIVEGQVQIGIRPGFPDEPVPDPPTINNVFARYVYTAGRNPEDNRQTVFLDYRSASGHVHAGDIYLTAIEELQIGVGPDAKVYRIDDVNGAAILAPELEPLRSLPSRAVYQEVVDEIAAP